MIEWKAMGEVADVILGQSPPGNTYNVSGDGLPFFQGKAEFGDIYPSILKFCSSPKKIAEPGDVLLSVRAPVGPTNLCTVRCCIGRGLAAIRPRSGMSSKYLLFAIRATVESLAKEATGSTFGAVSGDKIRAHQIPIGSPSMQSELVAEIEKQFSRLGAGIAALKRAQAKLKRYRASVLKSACEGKLVPTEAELAKKEGREYETGEQLLARILEDRRKNWKGKGSYKEPTPADTKNLPPLPAGWTWTSLDSLLEMKNGLNFTATEKGEVGMPVVDVFNMYSTTISVPAKGLYRVNKKVSADLVLQPGDILFVRSSVKREGVGFPTYFAGSNEPTSFCGFIIRGRIITPRIDARYLTYYLRTKHARERVIESASQVTITNINQVALSRIEVPFPPLEEQLRIVSEVERHLSIANELETTVTANLTRATRLRQSILQNAFSIGEN